MEKRTAGVVAVIITTLTCGLPGLVTLCAGLLGIYGAYLPEVGFTQADRTGATILLIGAGCLGFAGILVPILVAFFTLRQPKLAPLSAEDINKPIPPPG